MPTDPQLIELQAHKSHLMAALSYVDKQIRKLTAAEKVPDTKRIDREAVALAAAQVRRAKKFSKANKN